MRLVLVLTSLALALTGGSIATSGGPPAAAHAAGYEVWIIDQADTTADGGGLLSIYRDAALIGPRVGTPEVIDLGGAARDLCLDQTGTAPRRPHMMMFDHHHTHAILAFVASGHVLFIEAATRIPRACIDVGVQAHAASPSPDGAYVVVANQNGKLLQRIATDYAAGTFTLDAAATLDLATCTTPGGAPCQEASLRPDTAPICPIVDATSRLTFVTLRGGGLFVVDTVATPMAIVAEYDRATVRPNGCGGVETAGTMFINSGGGTAATPFAAELYAFPLAGFSTSPNPPNTPRPALVFSHSARRFVDSHGAVLTKNARFLWVADRAANSMVVVDTGRRQVVNEINLAGAASPNPAPDLLDISPDGRWVFLSLRGPNPLTGNVAGINNAAGSTPGLGIMRIHQDGRTGVLHRVVSLSRLVNGVEAADPHGLAVRRHT
jgi:DNA-binding beta-propeller fold protein YncE